MTEEHLNYDVENPGDTTTKPTDEPGKTPDEIETSTEISSYPIEKYKKQHRIWKTVGLCLIGFYIIACVGIIFTIRFISRKINGQDTMLDTIEIPVMESVSTVDSSVEWVPDDPFYRQNIEDGSTIIKVPAGDFLMGNPGLSVYLDEYWVYETEVTVVQYRDFLNSSDWPQDEYWKDWVEDRPNLHMYYSGEWWVDEGYEDYPVVDITWADARAYCQWAGGDLPTEAQWEKAARGEDLRNYPWGMSSWTGSFAFANICGTNCLEEIEVPMGIDDGYATAAPVGSYPEGASPYGALDMFGNVAEWTLDWYAANDFDQIDLVNPQGPSNGETRVYRGGSWRSGIFYYEVDGNGDSILTQLDIRSRGSADPQLISNSLGFRCVIEP